MGTRGVGRTIVKNVIFNTIGRFYGLIVSFFLTPLIIHSVGSAKYGLWVIVGVITGYFGLLDFGVGSSFMKYIAEFQAHRDTRQLNQLVNTGLVFYGAFGLFVFLLMLFLLAPGLAFFNISSVDHPEAYTLFLIGITLFVVSNMMSSVNTLLMGFQRMDIANKVAVLGTTLTALCVYIVLEMDFGLIGLICVNVFVFAVTSSLNFVYARRIEPHLSINPFLFRKSMLKKLLGFGIKLQVGRFADLLSFEAHKLIMGKFVNLHGVGMYQVGTQLASQTRNVPLLLLSSLMPAVSEISSLGEKEKLKKLYMKGSKYLAIISVPLAFFSIVTAPFIIRVWIGEGFGEAALVVQLLTIGYLANLNLGVASSISIGSGKPEMQMRAGIVTSIVTVSLNIFFAMKLGFIGVPIATSISLIIGAAYFYWEFSRYIKIEKLKTIAVLYAKPVFVSMIIAVVFFFVSNRPSIDNLFESRIVGVSVLAVEGIVFFTLYGLALMASRYIEHEDVETWKNAFQFEKFTPYLPYINSFGKFLGKLFPEVINGRSK